MPSGSNVPLLSLSVGDGGWDISGVVYFAGAHTGSDGTEQAVYTIGISQDPANFAALGSYKQDFLFQDAVVGFNIMETTPMWHVVGPTTVYLLAAFVFLGPTAPIYAQGYLSARPVSY
jgi:hypothetical protein